MESMWKNMEINLGWNAGIDDIMVVNSMWWRHACHPFKTSFRLWFNAKIFHLHKHAFLQMLFMHFYIRQFHPQSDCGQSCLV
jgi:hypothetical protein